jgi:hypothetical protein
MRLDRDSAYKAGPGMRAELFCDFIRQCGDTRWPARRRCQRPILDGPLSWRRPFQSLIWRNEYLGSKLVAAGAGCRVLRTPTLELGKKLRWRSSSWGFVQAELRSFRFGRAAGVEAEDGDRQANRAPTRVVCPATRLLLDR